MQSTITFTPGTEAVAVRNLATESNKFARSAGSEFNEEGGEVKGIDPIVGGHNHSIKKKGTGKQQQKKQTKK